MLRKLIALFRGPDRQRGDGERCETCHWNEGIGDDPDDEPNGYCVEPGNAYVNHPYAGSFVHTQSWCRLWKPIEEVLASDGPKE